jgi:hypothetical protein
VGASVVPAKCGSATRNSPRPPPGVARDAGAVRPRATSRRRSPPPFRARGA